MIAVEDVSSDEENGSDTSSDEGNVCDEGEMKLEDYANEQQSKPDQVFHVTSIEGYLSNPTFFNMVFHEIESHVRLFPAVILSVGLAALLLTRVRSFAYEQLGVHNVSNATQSLTYANSNAATAAVITSIVMANIGYNVLKEGGKLFHTKFDSHGTITCRRKGYRMCCMTISSTLLAVTVFCFRKGDIHVALGIMVATLPSILGNFFYQLEIEGVQTALKHSVKKTIFLYSCMTITMLYFASMLLLNDDSTASVIICGIVYPAFEFFVRQVALRALSTKKERNSVKGIDFAQNQKRIRRQSVISMMSEIGLSVPNFVLLYGLKEDSSFFAAAGLSMLCELGGILFNAMRHSNRADKMIARSPYGASSRINTVVRRTSLKMKKLHVGVRFCAEEYAERFAIYISALFAHLLLPDVGIILAVYRCASLAALEFVVDIGKRLIMRAFHMPQFVVTWKHFFEDMNGNVAMMAATFGVISAAEALAFLLRE